MSELTRRSFVSSSIAGLALGTGVLSMHQPATQAVESVPTSRLPIRFCLNTSTIRKQGLSLPETIDLAASVGYDSIEPWIREIDNFVSGGGQLTDVRKQLEDRRLGVESAIGFPTWIVDDDEQRAKGFEEAKRGMALVRELGGNMIAAPPIGAHGGDSAKLNLDHVAERYHQLLELGVSMGVTPQLEIWGPSKNLSTMREAMYVAVAAAHPQVGILPDVYHMFRGGSSFESLRLLSGQSINLFHMNDYPDAPPREQMRDSDRVYPGDGVAPFELIVKSLQSIGFRGALSLELFNPDYWKQDAKLVAKTGLDKMREVIKKYWT